MLLGFWRLVSKLICAPQHEQILPGSDYASSTFDAAHNTNAMF
jgi:hypothetical protein